MDFDAVDLAERLMQARRRAEPIKHLGAAVRPSTVEQGYEVQAAAFADRGAVAGYKVALTSAPAQAAFGSKGPVYGRLSASDILSSPARLKADRLPTFAEAELVFVMAESLDPAEAPFSAETLGPRIGDVRVGIELCSTRYAWDEASLAELVADNANAWALVIGDSLAGWRERDLSNIEATLTLTGQPPIVGASGAVLGDPIRSLVWLADWLAQRGEGLSAGQVIASGSCTGVTPLSGERIEDIVADFGGLGRARATVTPQQRSAT